MKRRQESVLVEEEGIMGDEEVVKASEKVVEKSDKGSELEQLPGVGAATAEKLILGGYDTLLSVAAGCHTIPLSKLNSLCEGVILIVLPRFVLISTSFSTFSL